MDLVTLENQLDNISFAVLFATMLLYWVGAAFPSIAYLPSLATAGMAIANLVMAVLLSARWIEAGYFPISNLYESLFFLAWGLTTAHLIAEGMSKSKLVGVVTAPVAMGITAFAALTLPADMRVSEPLVPALKSNWLMMHVSVMMLSYSALLVGALMAIAYLVITWGRDVPLQGSSWGNGGERSKSILPQEPEISELDLTTLTSPSFSINTATLVNLTSPVLLTTANTLTPQRLTLAETLDNISYRIIGLGFPLLTIGIIAGAVWANEAWGSYWSWDPKETWALITWLIFAAYLHARITRGWQGKKPAILAATGFVVVWICYLGVNLLGKGLHSYGWFL
jgi:cytochrome c-type biogenesis protein CcsB